MAYITVQDVRAECISESEYPDDSYITARIAIAQQNIELLTGRFFEVRTGFKLILDGSGLNRLLLSIPPKDGTTAITEVKINDGILDATEYKYTLRTFPDDRFNPKIVLVSGTWPKGTLNIEITGDFGFVEADGTVPPLIKQLCKMLTIWELPKLTDSAAGRSTQIIEEELGDYRYKLSEISRSGGFFGDQKIDRILSMYRTRTITTV